MQNINPKSLKGKDVFNRTLELMDKLTPINESVINASLEFIKKAPNGLVYTIIRENHKYFIKNTDKTEFKVSDLDYIGGLKNKMNESYPSYEEALKHLNMKFQELNELYGIKSGYNLFEQDNVDSEEVSNEETGLKEKKYKLKVKSDDTETTEDIPMPSAEAPTSGESPMGEEPEISDVPSPEGEGSPIGGDEMPGEEPTEGGEEMPEEAPIEGGGEDEEDLDIEDDEEDPKKYIQKLTGRLGQKLRELPEVDPKLEKYVINSIISALHVDKMDKKDRMDVIRKFKKKKGMESIMKESHEMDEYYGMMSLNGPFNFQKIKGGFDENSIESHPKKHRPLRFKKYEVDMDEELHGNQDKLDLNKNGRLDKEDFRMLRSKKKNRSSDEQGWGTVARIAAPIVVDKAIDYFTNKDESDNISFHRAKDEEMDREQRLKDALTRIKKKREFEKRKKEMDEVSIENLFNRGGNEPDVADPEIEIEEPLTPPTPDFPDPWNPEKPKVMPHPKARKKEHDVNAEDKDLTFESIIKKYKVKK